MRSIKTHSAILKKKDSFTYLSVQRHFIASEKLVKKDTAVYERQMFKPSKIPLYTKIDEEVTSICN